MYQHRTAKVHLLPRKTTLSFPPKTYKNVVSESQVPKKHNLILGNTTVITDLMEAANVLLKREYGRVTKGELTTAVFMPQVSSFMSKEYDRDIPTLEDVDKTIDDSYEYLKNEHLHTG